MAVAPTGAASVAAPTSMERLIALQPLTIGPAEFAPGPPHASDVLATAEVDGVRFAARSGHRAIGVRPGFPSAALILAAAEDTGWHDLAFADEVPDCEIGAVTLTVLAAKLRATYVVRSAGGGALHRAVELDVRPQTAPTLSTNWTKLPDYPVAPGMAGIIAGTHGGVMIAAGGANFPDRMPWDGAKKIYYDQILVLRPGEPAWRVAGKLPEPRAYAAVVSLPDGVLVAGGENADAIFQDVLQLRWTGEEVAVDKAPSLPAPTTSAVATVTAGRVYLAGGFAPGAVRVSRSEFLQLELDRLEEGWKSLPTWPGPARAMAVTAAFGGAVYLMSGLAVETGADGEARSTYLRDAYRYRVDNGAWERLADMPWSAIAAPSPAPVTTAPAQIFVLGGVDGRQVGKLPRDTRVPADILSFDVASGAWRLWPERWPEPVVTTPSFELNGQWYFVSGEIMAGVRTTHTWAWRIPEAP